MEKDEVKEDSLFVQQAEIQKHADEKIAKPETPKEVLRSFNLKDIFKKTEEEITEEPESHEDKPRTPFTEEELQKLWIEFLGLLKNNNEIPTYSALSTGKLELLEDFKIQFEFNSASLVNELNLQKENLMKFLHSKLNNYGIEFVTKIAEIEESNVEPKDKVFKGIQSEKQTQEQKPSVDASEVEEKDEVKENSLSVTQTEIQKPRDEKIIKPGTSKEVARSFNLKDIFEKTEEEITEEPESYDDKPRTPFTEEELQKLWTGFLDLLKNNNEIPAYNALSTGKCELLEDFRIQFEFSSASLVNELNLQKENLMRFLHSKLNNYGIKFVTKITEAEENYVKSKDEIFREMAEKNPVLRKFKNEFGLDYDN